MREALELWRGPPLADFAYEAFAQAAIAQLDELRLAAVEDRVEANLALGCARELVGELRDLVARYPLRERLRGQLMLSLYRSGRQAEALEVYQDFRRALAEELGLEPGSAPPAQAIRSSQQTPEADLATTMSPTRGFTNYGNHVSFTATVTNKGPNTAQNVAVTDSFFSASFVAVSGPGCTPPPIMCTTASLAPGHSITIIVGLVARAIHNQLMGNSATATSSTYDPNGSNNTAGGALRSN